MFVKVIEDAFVPADTIVEVHYIDNVGDARLTEEERLKYGTRWLFKGTFTQYYENEEKSTEEQPGYIMVLKVRDLLELHDLLQELPQSMLETAELTKN